MLGKWHEANMTEENIFKGTARAHFCISQHYPVCEFLISLPLSHCL